MRRRRLMTLRDVETRNEGPELTPYDVARIARGTISDDTIRRDIRRGRLQAREERRGTTTVRWIRFAEARRYLRERGIVDVECSTGNNAAIAATAAGGRHAAE